MKEDDESGEIKRPMAASKRSGQDVEKAKEGGREKGGKGSVEWLGAQGRSGISPGTADVQGDPERRDGKTAEKDDGFPSPPDRGCCFNTLVIGLSLFPLFARKEKRLYATIRMKKPSGMALWLYSHLSRRCRLFNNLLMTVINNVSGLQTAGI